MKSWLKFLLILAIPVVLFLSVNQYFSNTYDGRPLVSNSIETSQENNLYLGVYKPTKDSIILKDKKIKAVNAWAEISWQRGHDLLFISTIIKKPGINIIVPYIWDTEHFPDFWMETADGWSRGSNPGVGFEYLFVGEPETISLVIAQKKNDSWEETIDTDTIVYKKAF